MKTIAIILGLAVICQAKDILCDAQELKQVCRDKPIDVYFVVDISKSISNNELDVERAVIRNIINSFQISPNGIRIGLITFFKTAQHVFNLTKYSSSSELPTSDKDLVPRGYKPQGTYTHRALDAVRAVFEHQPRKGAAQVAIVITDGKSKNGTATKLSAERIHRHTNITVIAVGVGKQLNKAEIENIASGPGAANVHYASKFSDLPEMEDLIVTECCTAVQEPICKNKKLDVYFVVDKSRSIKDDELETERLVVYGIMKSLGISNQGIHAGIISYDRHPEVVFNLTQYTSWTQLESVDLIPRPQVSGGTFTDRALNLLRAQLAAEGRKDAKGVGIVISDGRSHDLTDTKTSAELIHKDGKVTLIAIGVGNGLNVQDLENIATGDGQNNVLYADDFEQMSELKGELAQLACSDD